VNDFTSEEAKIFEESKNTKRDQKKKQKAFSGTVKPISYSEPFDLTGDESPVYEQMNQYASRKSWNKEILASGYLGDESGVATPPSRKKRDWDHGSRVNLWQRASSYEGSHFQELMNRYKVKKAARERSSSIISNEGGVCGKQFFFHSQCFEVKKGWNSDFVTLRIRTAESASFSNLNPRLNFDRVFRLGY
jgi:hypothetical protein